MANLVRIDSFHSGDFHKCSNNGPGFRVIVWLSGCRRNCPECHNKEEQDFNYGTQFTQEDLDFIINELKDTKYSGLSILGGEPFEPENIDTLALICESVRKVSDKSIWIWSGFTLEGLKEKYKENSSFEIILKTATILVDGPFIKDLKNLNLKFRGSSNQKIIELQTGKILEDTDI